MRETLRGYRRAAGRPAFRRFWLGMMISRAGDAFTMVALSWVVLGIAGPAQLGLVLMCFGLPRIVSGPVAGRLLDRFRPRPLLAADNAARGLLIAAVPVLLWQHHDAASFAIMAVICLRLPPFRTGPPQAREDLPHGSDRDWLGLGVLFRFPAVLVLAACGFGMLFLDGVATVLYPVYCRTFLHAGPAGYGVLVSAAGAGALLGVVAGPGLSGRLPPSLRIGAVIVAGAPLFGLLRLAPDVAVAADLLALAAFAQGPYYVFERTLQQRVVPDRFLSRVAGARMTISSLGFPLGSAIGGVIIGGIGVPAVILAIACSYLVLGLLPLRAPALRATPAFPDPPRPTVEFTGSGPGDGGGMGGSGPVGFDLDMTLINSRPAILASFSQVARETGTAIDPDAVDRRLGVKLEDELAFWFPPERVAAAAEIYRRHYLRLAEPMTTVLPGAHEALAAVRAAGQRAVIITAKHLMSAGPSLRAAGLVPDELFTLAHGPEKAAVLRRLKAVAYVGDTPPDMAAAVQAGARAVGVTTGSFTGEELAGAGADVVLDSLAGFPAWYRSA